MKLRLIKGTPSAAKRETVATEVFDYVYHTTTNPEVIVSPLTDDDLQLGFVNARMRKAVLLATGALPTYLYKLKKFILDYQGAAFLTRKYVACMIEQLSADGSVHSYDYHDGQYLLETISKHLITTFADQSFAESGRCTLLDAGQPIHPDLFARRLFDENYSSWDQLRERIPHNERHVGDSWQVSLRSVNSYHRSSAATLHSMVVKLEDPRIFIGEWKEKVLNSCTPGFTRNIGQDLIWKCGSGVVSAIVSTMLSPALELDLTSEVARAAWEWHMSDAGKRNCYYDIRHIIPAKYLYESSDEEINGLLLSGFKLKNGQTGEPLNRDNFDKYVTTKVSLLTASALYHYSFGGVHSHMLFGPKGNNCFEEVKVLDLKNILDK